MEKSLKKILMALGNRLVEEGYNPAVGHKEIADSYEFKDSTLAVAILTEFINNSYTAQEILKEMGLDWEIKD